MKKLIQIQTNGEDYGLYETWREDQGDFYNIFKTCLNMEDPDEYLQELEFTRVYVDLIVNIEDK